MDWQAVATGLFGSHPSYIVKTIHFAVVACIALLVLAGVLQFMGWLWLGWAALAAVLLVAHRAHPGVRWTWFFMPGRRMFTLLVFGTGLLLRPGLMKTFDGIGGRGSLADFAVGIVCLALSTVGAWYVVKVLEGKKMGNVFKLVAPESEGALLSKLRALDKHAGVAGQAADFAGLDADTVARAIEEQVIGQDSTVGAVVHTAFRRARLARPNKPVATFLFVGATGAGKTELSKALASQLFAGRMIRVDCNELSVEQGVQRLIGSPPGYTDSEKGGWLCRELARVGTGVLLLDEIEKAHPAVLKTLMGLLDEAADRAVDGANLQRSRVPRCDDGQRRAL